MEQVFEKYIQGDNIIKYQYRNIQPESTLDLNHQNKKTYFKIDVGDNFIDPNFKYKIKGKVVKEDGTKLDDNNNVKLIDNFPAHLFSDIEVKKNNKRLDQIEDVGVASTIKGTVSFALYNNGPTINSGYQSNYTKNVHNFSVVGNLSNFALGFFKDVTYPIYKGNFDIIFTRNDVHFTIHKTSSEPKVKIIIEEFLIKVRIITFDDISKIKLINELEKLSNNKQYTFNFRSWQCIRNDKISGKNVNFNITNYYRNNLNKPLFGIVAFQTNKHDNSNQDQDCSIFSHCDVENIWFEVNGQKYPEELLNLDWENNDFSEAYEMLSDYKKLFAKNNELEYINPNQFKNMRPFFVIDLTKQPDNINKSIININLKCDFNKKIPNNTICYICLISEARFAYDFINNTINEIF